MLGSQFWGGLVKGNVSVYRRDVHVPCAYVPWTEESIQEGMSARTGFLPPFILSEKYSSRDFPSLDLLSLSLPFADCPGFW